MIQLENLTLGEIEDLELKVNAGIDEIGDILQRPGPKSAIMRAMFTLIKRREDPNWTDEDSRNIPYTEIADFLGEIESPKAQNRKSRRHNAKKSKKKRKNYTPSSHSNVASHQNRAAN